MGDRLGALSGLLLLVIWAVACSVTVGCREGEGNPMSQNSELTGDRTGLHTGCAESLKIIWKHSLRWLDKSVHLQAHSSSSADAWRRERWGSAHTGSAQAVGVLEVLQGAPGRVFLSPCSPTGLQPSSCPSQSQHTLPKNLKQLDRTSGL